LTVSRSAWCVMKISVEPMLSLAVFSEDLQCIICIGDDDGAVPEVYVDEGVPRPDRHLLLGLVQSILMAVEEADAEAVAFRQSCTVRLERPDETKDLNPGLIVVRSVSGKFGAVTTADPKDARRLARRAVRWFTGTIRLDIP